MRDSDIMMPPSDSKTPYTLGLLLIDGFALMSYAAVVEAFRAANLLAGSSLYRWEHISVTDGPCRASNGAVILPDRTVGARVDCDTLFVFAGGNPVPFADERTFAWLRQMAVRGKIIAGISAGPYVLASAGLLEGYRATIHWEHRAAFADRFPTIVLDPGLYVIDRRRVTCAGGMAGMDLAVELIAREQGHGLAAQVSDWFIRSEPRAADRPQRLSLRDRYGITNDRVLKVLAAMEVGVEEPVTREALAQIAGISVRQLERLFLDHLNATIGATYLRIRLSQAERLLRTTTLSITEIAIACGFRSTSHFSRSFAGLFGISPSQANRSAAG